MIYIKQLSMPSANKSYIKNAIQSKTNDQMLRIVIYIYATHNILVQDEVIELGHPLQYGHGLHENGSSSPPPHLRFTSQGGSYFLVNFTLPIPIPIMGFFFAPSPAASPQGLPAPAPSSSPASKVATGLHGGAGTSRPPTSTPPSSHTSTTP